jgi:hypothetical protein
MLHGGIGYHYDDFAARFSFWKNVLTTLLL